MATFSTWLWPDREIGKRESRRLREEHNATVNSNAELLESVELWLRFFDEMPKGQFGKIVCNIGLMNQAFVKSRAAVENSKRK